MVVYGFTEFVYSRPEEVEVEVEIEIGSFGIVCVLAIFRDLWFGDVEFEVEDF